MSTHRNRLGELGSYYHVFSRGLDRKPLFHDDRDRNTFLLMLRDVLAATETLCYAFALMENHHHNVLRTVSVPISDVMHRINTRYALHHNRRHGGVGHVFQGRFGSVLIEDDTHLATAIAYVHANPIRAGIVPDEPALRDYRWTGHAALMGRDPRSFVDVELTLARFGDTRSAARRRLADMMRGYVSSDEADVPAAPYSPGSAMPLSTRDAESLTARSVVAIAGVTSRIDSALRDRDARTAARLRLVSAGWTPDRLLAALCRRHHVSPIAVRAGRRSPAHCRVRALFCHLATAHLGLSLVAAGREVALGRSGASRARREGLLREAHEGLMESDVFGDDPVRHAASRRA